MRKLEWILLLGLLLLSLVPCAGGLFRMIELGIGSRFLPENSRVLLSPGPVVIHLMSSIPYCILGAFQFLPSFRRRYPKWHRVSGRFLVIAGIASALSGLWMTHFYSFPVALQGGLLYGVRFVVGVSMVVFIHLGLAAIFKRRIEQHQAWMIRAYALGQGAGTQVLVSIPWLVISGEPSGLTRDLLMTLAWAINIFLAEHFINGSRSSQLGESQLRSKEQLCRN